MGSICTCSRRRNRQTGGWSEDSWWESKHELSITVVAPNPPLAATKAVEKADEYLATLSLAINKQRFYFGPTTVKKLPDRRGTYPHQYIPSGIGAAGVFYPETLKPDDEQYVKALLGLSRENKTFDRAVGYMRAAWRLRDVPLADPAI